MSAPSIQHQHLSPRQHKPAKWLDHSYELTWTTPHPREAVWNWLNNPRTFTRQVWPYRVEFVEASGLDSTSGFSPGVLNTHHGPFLNAAGVLTEIDAGDDGKGRYRDLHYYYGAYVLGMRLIRPTRLQFWLEDAPESQTKATVRLDSFVRPFARPIWNLGLKTFWSTFPGSMKRGVNRHNQDTTQPSKAALTESQDTAKTQTSSSASAP